VASVPVSVAVGDYVVNRTDNNVIPLNHVTEPSATPSEGTKIAKIAGRTITLSRAVVTDAGHGVQEGDIISFAHPRAGLRTLAQGCSTNTPGGPGCKYPWAIYGNGMGLPDIERIFVEGAWDGLFLHGDLSNGNSCELHVRDVHVGALNIGLDIDDIACGGYLNDFTFQADGLFLPNMTVTAFGEIFYDGQTVAGNLGKTDGLSVINFGSFEGKLNITSNWTFGEMTNVDMDSPLAVFNWAGGFGPISNLRTSKFVVSGGGPVVTNASIIGDDTPKPIVSATNGSQPVIIGGTLSIGQSGARSVTVDSGATMHLTGLLIGGPGTDWAGALIQALNNSAIDYRNNYMTTGGSGIGLSITTDSQWNVVKGNAWSHATFTPPGQAGAYEPGLASQEGGIIATGTTQMDAHELAAYYSNVNLTPLNSGVRLPAWAPLGSRWIIWNQGPNALKVYPPSGFTIGAGVNRPISVVAAGKLILIAWDAHSFLREQ
jgi:hypothetical protein